MGLMIGYANSDGDAFRPDGNSLSTVYMEGLSLCINDSNNIIKHVFSAGVSGTGDDIQGATNCFLYMYSGEIPSPPHVLGKDYQCYLQLNPQFFSLTASFTTTTAPFGDRDAGACEAVSTACRNAGRYFTKQLPNTYTVSTTGTTDIGREYCNSYEFY